MKKYMHIATVTGLGTFPIDMLRYDRCTPYEEADSSKIELTRFPHSVTEEKNHTIRVMKIDTNRLPSWTHERWASFLWRVVGTITRQMP